jgi:hypothetical protein
LNDGRAGGQRSAIDIDAFAAALAHYNDGLGRELCLGPLRKNEHRKGENQTNKLGDER